MTQPRLSDPNTTPRFPYSGSARREKPIWTQEQFGPWQCDVRVVPITGMRRHTVFEVNIQWAKGPPLDRSLGPTPATGMAASDSYYVDREAPDMMLTATEASEFAIVLAKAAADLLQNGVQPDLYRLARDLRKRFKS